MATTQKHNPNCTSTDHGKHLCYLMYEGYHLNNKDEYKKMVQDSNYRCQNCSRTANQNTQLCSPIEL